MCLFGVFLLEYRFIMENIKQADTGNSVSLQRLNAGGNHVKEKFKVFYESRGKGRTDH